jgi:hypothetical protein
MLNHQQPGGNKMPVRRSKSKRKINKWEEFLNDDFAVEFDPPPPDMPPEILEAARARVREKWEQERKQQEEKQKNKLWNDYIDYIINDSDPGEFYPLPEGMTPEIRDKLLKERKRKGKKDIYNI